MKKIVFLLILSQLIFSCKSFKIVSGCEYIISKNSSSTSIKTDSIDFSEYNLFVFKMCQTPEFNLKNTNQPELYAYPKYSNCTYNDLKNDTNLKSIEETYLYMPKPEYSNNPVVYITTFSHKYTFKNYGVFNCQAFKNKILLRILIMFI